MSRDAGPAPGDGEPRDASAGPGSVRETGERAGLPMRVRDGRETAVEALCEHFARDVLTVEEFEDRVDRAHRARTMDELRALLEDLPGGADALERAEASDREREGRGAVERARARVPAERVSKRSTVIAVMGGNARKGRWVPARQTNCVAVCGGVELDFREALMGPGVSDVNVFAVCGGVEIVVPPGLYVESSGMALMGSFENTEDHPVDRDPDAPVLRIHGLAVMGGVDVSARYPGESARDAKIRRKEERRARRRRLKGG